MTWNYRIFRKLIVFKDNPHLNEYLYVVKEAWYINGKLTSYTEDEIPASGNTLKDCLSTLKMMLIDALEQEVIDEDNFPNELTKEQCEKDEEEIEKKYEEYLEMSKE